jgi:uncharacterized protein YoxC
MLLQISAIVVALTFAVLRAEVTDVIHTTGLVTMDVRRKMNTFDYWFNSVSDIGQIVNVFTSTAKN